MIMWTQLLAISFLWLAFLVGCYILSYLIGYMNDKPPGQQTLLDGLYSQLFILMIVTGLFLSINFTLQEVEHQSMTSAKVIGYGSSVLACSVWIHFAICGALRFVIIYAPDKINEVPDHYIEMGVW